MQFLELVYSSFILLPIKYPTSMRHDCTVFHAGLPRYQTSRHDCTVFHAGLLLSDFETWLYSIPRRSAAIRLRDTTVEYSTQVCRHQTLRHDCAVFHADLPLSDFETGLYSIPRRSVAIRLWDMTIQYSTRFSAIRLRDMTYSFPRRSAAIRLRDLTVQYSMQICRYQTSRHNCRVFHAGLPPSDFETRRTVFHTGLPLSDFETWLYSIPHRSAGLVIVNWL